MPTLFLLNPGSGRKHLTPAFAQEIEALYADQNRRVKVADIDFSRLDEMVQQAIEERFDRVFAIGGDGTVNAIGTRLVGKSQAFGVIPAGSGNGFARNIGFSVHLPLAIRQSLDTITRRIDTARFNDHPFLNAAGVGAEADVLLAFGKLQTRGFVSYLRSTLKTLLHLRTFSGRLCIDGEWRDFTDMVSVVVANGMQWGYDVRITPRARLADGKLNVLLVHRFPLIDAAPLTRKMLMGDLTTSRYVESFEASSVIIQTEDQVNGHVDGEFVAGSREMHFSILPQSLSLLLPASLTEERLSRL